jgi:hypothetical protein
MYCLIFLDFISEGAVTSMGEKKCWVAEDILKKEEVLFY